MIRNLMAQQIQDWFTIGKTVTGVELLADASSLEEEVKPEKPRLKRCELEEQVTEGEHVNSSRDQKEPQNTHCEALPEADSSLLENDDEYLPGISLQTSRPRLSTLKTISMMQVADYRYPELPITKHREQLVDLIENNSVVIVRGATGSGKSTQLPQYILEYYLKKPAFCNIVVTQPRKIGAISIARWICKERCLSIGGLVGYQVGLEKEVGADTQLTYMTTGVLLQKIVNAKCLTEFTHIFIDEVHERTEEMDFLLLVVRKLLRTNSRFVKVILMSATINCMEFADYFAVPFRKTLTPAYVFEVDGVPYSIDEYYLDDLKELIHFQISPSFCNEPKILPEVYNTAVTLILYFDELENKENGSTGMNLNRGSVLVFLPGLAEINYLHEVLTSMVQKRLHVYPLHSSVTLEEQSNAFLTPVPGYRKIILSTNIAESSVTVSDVKYVVDFCLTRHLVCDEDTNYQSLRLSWASKMSCNQRKGRAGRVSKGYCYRLVTCDFWTHCIPDHAVPEMQRCPLGSTVLKVKLLDMGEPRALLASALSPPNLKDIERTVLLLKEVGALSIEIKGIDNPYDGDLTFLGKVLAYLPVDLHLGKLIVLGHVFGCLEECLIIAAALSLKNFFAVPFKQHLEGYRNKMEYSDGTLSDCIALVNAFKAWRTCREQGQLRFPRAELEWGKSNYIQIKRIKEVAQLYEELKERVQCFNMCVDHPSGCTNEEYVHKQRFILQVVLAGAFYPNYFTFGPVSEEIAMKELARKDYKTTVVVRNVPPYGFLYYQQLLSLFRQCGQIRALSFDGSKGFIEFVQNPIKRAQIHPAVYMALKMAHQRIPLQLKVHSVEEIELLIQGQPSSGLRSPRFCVGYQNWTVQLMPEEKSHGPLELPCNPVPRFFTMNVTEVVEVGHFWGYRTDGQSLHTLSKLMTEINQLKLTALSLEPCPDFCLAPFTECNETHYYRAKVLQVSGNSAEVFFVDYGNTAKVTIDLLRNIPHNLLELPFQALQCQLCNIRPSAYSLIHGDQWNVKARRRFSSLVKNCVLLVKVFSVVHNVLRVDLTIQTSKLDCNVREILISEGFAEPAEETYESKISHEQLKTILDSSLQEKLGLTQKTVWTQKEEDWKHIQTLIQKFSSSKLGFPSSTVHLHGPYSPYETKFHSMTTMSRFRNVWIEKESINSVSLNNAPEDTHQRMLIGASVSVNTSGSTIIVRETTLMPNIHGLPTLICLLFAPVVELRTERRRKYYTGALCGLGWNPINNAPLLEEHDLEVVFDVHFDVNDIMEINLLRSTINMLVCDGLLRSGNHEKIRKLQNEARQRLIDIFTGKKLRESMTPQYCERPYKWNQVDPSLLLNQSREENKIVLYQMHSIVLLNP
ncbi:ATP-dependent RNA helicase TDRD9 [Chiloscyllium plagiosum]|uniref:ATP-dependent RNA helicase TDRD9 n=1 Tax=Chiloscyllium plagiosum TaxID=36176 RepID=UPI001CB80331|nr:ATP-dependent RNA helicase TDRD9 [Chiloscyllium plagiosum]